MKCSHWRDCGLNNGGCCAVGEFANPSTGVCLTACERNDAPDRESAAAEYLESMNVTYAGTALKSFFSSIGIHPCGGCDQRAADLDDWDKNTVRPAIAKVGRATKRLLSGRSP